MPSLGLTRGGGCGGFAPRERRWTAGRPPNRGGSGSRRDGASPQAVLSVSGLYSRQYDLHRSSSMCEECHRQPERSRAGRIRDSREGFATTDIPCPRTTRSSTWGRSTKPTCWLCSPSTMDRFLKRLRPPSNIQCVSCCCFVAGPCCSSQCSECSCRDAFLAGCTTYAFAETDLHM